MRKVQYVITVLLLILQSSPVNQWYEVQFFTGEGGINIKVLI